MKKKGLLLFSVFFMIFAFSGCEDAFKSDKNYRLSPLKENEPVPMSVDNYWVYRIESYDKTVIDTTWGDTVKVIGIENINNEEWYHFYSVAGNCDYYQTQREDGIYRGFGDCSDDEISIHYKFPCEKGDVFESETGLPSDHKKYVGATDTLMNIDIGKFRCIEYYYYGLGTNDDGSIYYTIKYSDYVCPGVGLILFEAHYKEETESDAEYKLSLRMELVDYRIY